MASKHARKHRIRVTLPPVKKKVRERKKEFRLDSNEFGFICAGVSNLGGYI